MESSSLNATLQFSLQFFVSTDLQYNSFSKKITFNT